MNHYTRFYYFASTSLKILLSYCNNIKFKMDSENEKNTTLEANDKEMIKKYQKFFNWKMLRK